MARQPLDPLEAYLTNRFHSGPSEMNPTKHLKAHPYDTGESSTARNRGSMLLFLRGFSGEPPFRA